MSEHFGPFKLRSEQKEPDAKKASARKGGLMGGLSRARAISSERRIEIAKKASRARWSRTKADLPME